MNKIILDSNCYTAYLAGDPKLLQVLTEAKTTYMSIFVLGELNAGFKGGTREKENQSIHRKFLNKPSVIVVNASIETADVFGMVKDMLRQIGCPIPINYVWIAAHALECGASASNSRSTFSEHSRTSTLGKHLKSQQNKIESCAYRSLWYRLSSPSPNLHLRNE